jgi:UrcA family protein
MRCSVLALLLLLTAVPAQAEPRRTLTMTRISVGDLDLSTEGGAATLLRRLNVAAKAMCAPIRTPLLPQAEGRAYRCRREAVAAAVERLDTPAVRRAYAILFSAPPASP